MAAHRDNNTAVRLAHRVEGMEGLDGVVGFIAPLARWLIDKPGRRDALQGRWLGHALHPLMTDVPIGMWLSGTTLDLVGGPASAPAAKRLIGLGVLAALPTAVTGVAEWASIQSPGSRRTGILHALVNDAALGCYSVSWLARRRRRTAAATAWALAGGAAMAVGGYLGGHLTEARKISSRHPAFDAD